MDKKLILLKEQQKQIHDLKCSQLPILKRVLSKHKSLIKPIDYLQGQKKLIYGRGIYTGTKTLDKMSDSGQYMTFFYMPSYDSFIVMNSEEDLREVGVGIFRLFASSSARAIDEEEAVQNINIEKIITNLDNLHSKKPIKFSADREDTNFVKYWGLKMTMPKNYHERE